MTPRQAYDDCIAQAREAARRQQISSEEPGLDPILAALHRASANTLTSFANMLEKLRDIRCE